MMIFAAATGLRLSELFGLECRDVERGADVVYVRHAYANRRLKHRRSTACAVQRITQISSRRSSDGDTPPIDSQGFWVRISPRFCGAPFPIDQPVRRTGDITLAARLDVWTTRPRPTLRMSARPSVPPAASRWASSSTRTEECAMSASSADSPTRRSDDRSALPSPCGGTSCDRLQPVGRSVLNGGAKPLAKVLPHLS
jgi:integrase